MPFGQAALGGRLGVTRQIRCVAIAIGSSSDPDSAAARLHLSCWITLEEGAVLQENDTIPKLPQMITRPQPLLPVPVPVHLSSALHYVVQSYIPYPFMR